MNIERPDMTRMKLLRPLLQRSLTRRMLSVQLLGGGLMLATLFIALWQLSAGQARAETERAVEQIAYVLVELEDPARNAPRLIERLVAAADGPDDQVRFEIRDAQGALLSASATSPRAVSTGWLTADFRDADNGRTVLVAADEGVARKLWTEDSVYLMSRVALATFWLIGPVMLFATVLLTRFALAPIRELSRDIAARTPNKLTPVATAKRYPELAPLVDELNRLMEKLRDAQAAEQRFFADAAHALLTPVAALRAQTHLLTTALDAREKQRAHTDVEGGLLRLTSSIRQLLAIARVSSAEVRLNMRVQDLVPLAQDRVGAAALRALDKHIDISLEAPRECPCVFDRETIVTVLDNLVDNSIRYLPATERRNPGRIKITLRQYRHAVWIVVADNGPGIPAEYRDKVVERFVRVPGNNETGSGLGLAIVAQIVMLHQGLLVLRDGFDESGLMVCVRLPAVAATSVA